MVFWPSFITICFGSFYCQSWEFNTYRLSACCPNDIPIRARGSTAIYSRIECKNAWARSMLTLKSQGSIVDTLICSHSLSNSLDWPSLNWSTGQLTDHLQTPPPPLRVAQGQQLNTQSFMAQNTMIKILNNFLNVTKQIPMSNSVGLGITLFNYI